MIIWEQAPNGHIECLVNDCYGVVGLANPRTGWTARLYNQRGRYTAPTLFHTASEAKAWVEHRIKDRCCELHAQTAPSYSTSTVSAAPATLLASLPASPSALWSKWWRAAQHAVATYQHWNAAYLDPRRYGQQPLCYASSQVNAS